MLFRFFFKIFIIFGIIYFIPQNSNANIYEVKCANKKNATHWVYSFKRNQVILSRINTSPTKIKFTMERKTPTSFVAKGTLSKYKTDIIYDVSSGDLSVMQSSLRGTNQFYKCDPPVLRKEE